MSIRFESMTCNIKTCDNKIYKCLCNTYDIYCIEHINIVNIYLQMK